jgi:hypothetical protein
MDGSPTLDWRAEVEAARRQLAAMAAAYQEMAARIERSGRVVRESEHVLARPEAVGRPPPSRDH